MVCWDVNVDWPRPWFGQPSALRSDRRRQSRQPHQVVCRNRYISLLLDLLSIDESGLPCSCAFQSCWLRVQRRLSQIPR